MEIKQIKMGIVGAGTWGETHASIYAEHLFADPVAICDKDEVRARAIAEKYGIREVYTDYNEMAEKSDIDAVAIVTPDFLHADIACKFADCKKHLLIEKPLATTREDIGRICEAVERNGVRCMVDLHNRWNPPFNTAKQEVESGKLGEPYTAYIRHSDVKWVATDMLKWASKSSILWFLGSHSLDTLRWIFDDEVKRVYSIKKEGILKALGVDTADIYLTTIEFERGGIAHMENGWVTPNGNTNINDFKFSLLCTKGMVSLDLSSHNLIHLVTDEKAVTPDILVSNMVFDRCKGLSYESIRDFIDRLVDGKEFRVTLEDSRKTALAIIAMLESSETGMPVEVEY
ncbi:putative dehydrogenase [Ruminiclostridium sufflavum DSM 19573]|uniref:Putative dehydrogenase n=1 Tax=Ruminiclostridium sufflavum DSM 19573 TaxID=1121337 RepID=A0A318XNV6_9FIRM|nr:Gfo/Idh/MocA family oxidoreductase [Ruminiclostridium sufflavum]PYG88723.1 putative dehydrogenase [Ruminiclostridium sufflavum DSM 19573]